VSEEAFLSHGQPVTDEVDPAGPSLDAQQRLSGQRAKFTDGAVMQTIDSLRFVFAKTMPDEPHEWVKRTDDNNAAFTKLWEAIGTHGVPGHYRGDAYRYFYPGDGWKYWTTPGLDFLINRAAAASDVRRVSWSGPYAWPGFEVQTGLRPLPSRPGVYLWTFEYRDGHLIYWVGESNAIRERFSQHTRFYMSGNYSVLDIAAACRGSRRELWSGWWYSDKLRARLRGTFATRRVEIQAAARRQLAAFRLFVTGDMALLANQRSRQRLEAAIINRLYAADPLLCDMQESGVFRAPRRPGEEPVIVANASAAILHGLPQLLAI
jgi:hypothetical protein